MNIQEIMKIKDIPKRLDKLCVDPVENRSIQTNLSEYKGKHIILDRKDKRIGEAAKELADGTITEDTRKVIKLHKLVLKLQKKIVRSSKIFLFGKPVKLILENDKDEEQNVIFKKFKDQLKNVKIDSFNRKLAQAVFSESKAAELWYIKPTLDADSIEHHH